LNQTRIKRVAFADASVRKAYEELEGGRFEEKELKKHIDTAIRDLKESPFCGIMIPSKLWPKEYVLKFKVNNLWKYDLPRGWRLVYFVAGNEIEIVSIILEWFDYEKYEKRFGYKKR